MAYSSTFRNIFLSAALAAGSNAVMANPDSAPANSPESIHLAAVLNASVASKAQSEHFHKLIGEENFGQNPKYAFSVTQRCKALGFTAIDSFKDCARAERAKDLQSNSLIAIGGVTLVLGAGAGVALWMRRRKEFAELGAGTFSRPFD